MEFPEPVIELAIEPKTKAGQGKMGEALAKLAEEDPTFRAHTNQETGQTIIAGMGELHLEIIVDRLLREFKVEANVGAPQVAKQSGGRGQYGHCKVKFEPMDANGEELFKFESALSAVRFRRNISPQSEKVSKKLPKQVSWADSRYWAFMQCIRRFLP